MGICVSCRRRARKAPSSRSPPGAVGPAKGAAAELLPRQDMANSMSNIKMTNPIKSIVSGHRKRFMKDGYNLDLAYITDRLIAMGFPAEKLEAVYRNHIDEVYRFLEQYHKDRYKIYNLCSERAYDPTKFHERVKRYAFDDHTPPTIEMIQPFCEDVHQWLGEDARNVAAIHCKAGKGRTGTMVCCYLLYSRQKATADEALKFYGNKRTHDDKGVTIPSQRRYVEYYASLLHSGLQYSPTKIYIRELVMSPPPALHAANAVPELIITQAVPYYKTPPGCQEVTRTETSLHMTLLHCTPLCGDVRVDVCKPKMKMRNEKLFHFWFNTFFVAAGLSAAPHPPPHDSPNLETYKLTLNKSQLDDAHKDKQHKQYSQDFKVELIVQVMPAHATFTGQGQTVPPSPSPPSSSASDCSEPRADTDQQDWDSGEHPIPYTRLPDTASIPDEDKADEARLIAQLEQNADECKPEFGIHDGKPDNTGSQTDFHRDANNQHTASNISLQKGTKIDNVRKAVAASDSRQGDLVNNTGYDKDRYNLDYKKGLGLRDDAFDQRRTPIETCLDRVPSQNAFDYKGNDEAMEFCDSADDVFTTESPTEESKKRDDKTKPRLSLGDMRASWREFSGKFASDSRKRKDDS